MNGTTSQAVVLQKRTRQFALAVIRLVQGLPRTAIADVLGRHLLRSATSVGADYRAACRAKSTADFVAKMKIVEEEADECLYWLDLLVESGLATSEQVLPLLREGNEFVAITVASVKTVRRATAPAANRQSSIHNRQSR